MKKFLLILALSVPAAAPVLAASLTERSMFTGTATFDTGAPAYRARGQNSGGELFVGINDLGVGGNRSESNFTYAASQSFSFSYDRGTGAIGGSLSRPGETDTLGYAGTAGTTYNAVLMILRGPGRDGALFDVSGLTVNGESLGSVSPGAGFNEYILADFADLTTLTVSGLLNLSGTANANDGERLKLEFKLGTVSQIPLPAALPLSAAGLALLGALARRRRG